MSSLASVITCDTCGGALETVPGLGLLCNNGCSFDRLGKGAKPEPRSEATPETKPAPRLEDGQDWSGQPIGKPADPAPAPKTPHQRLRERWDVPERPTTRPAVPTLAVPEAATRPPTAPTWEVYDGRWVKGASARVRLSKTGSLAVGAVLLEKIGSPDRVELLFDRGTRRIGIRKGEGPHTMKVARHLNGVAGIVSARGLLGYYGVTLPKTSVVIAPTVEAGVLVVPVGEWAHE